MNPRTELSLINKHVRQHNREAMTEDVVWFEFLALGGGGSVYDDVYNEGAPGSAGRVYAKGIRIPTIYISENEDEFVPKDEGRQPMQTLRLTILFKDAELAGLSNTAEFKEHLNDILWYAGRYYKVNSYIVWGRLPSEVVIGVQGFEIFPDQELVWDTSPVSAPSILPWPAIFPIQLPASISADVLSYPPFEPISVGSCISVGPLPPENKSLIWIDTSMIAP